MMGSDWMMFAFSGRTGASQGSRRSVWWFYRQLGLKGALFRLFELARVGV